MIRLKPIINTLIILSGIALTGAFTLEAFFYGGLMHAHLGINLFQLSIAYVIALFLSRQLFPLDWLKKFVTSITLYFLPVISWVAVILDFADDILYANFSFSTFHFHPLQLHFLVLFITLTCLIYSDWKTIWRKKKHFIFGFPIVTISIIALMKHLYYSTWFHFLRKEDSIFEYITAIGYFLGGLVMLKNARLLQSKNTYRLRRIMAPFCFLVGISLVMVAGEEISWGQRIVGIETPDFIAEVNTQNEITIHNHESILPYVYYAYFAIAAYGVVSAIVKTSIQKTLLKNQAHNLHLIDFFAPDWYLIPLFIPTLYYTLYRFTLGWTYHGIGQWEETSEMYLGIAGFIFALSLWRKVLKHKQAPATINKSVINQQL